MRMRMSQRALTGSDDEGETVDPGDGREAGEERVVDLGVAEQIPGKAGDAGAGQLHGYPGEGHKQKSALAAEALGYAAISVPKRA